MCGDALCDDTVESRLEQCVAEISCHNGTTAAVLVFATLLVRPPLYAEERPVVVSNLKELVGEWQGSLSGVRGGTVPYTFWVSEDGTWKGLSPNGPSNGTLRLDQGVIGFFSQTTGRRGTLTLYEVDRKRVLRLQGEGGASFEVRRK
jgi:hypothetical protein